MRYIVLIYKTLLILRLRYITEWLNEILEYLIAFGLQASITDQHLSHVGFTDDIAYIKMELYHSF